MNKVIVGSLIVIVLASGGILTVLRKTGSNQPVRSTEQKSATTTNGKQIIEIKAKGGYAPHTTLAKANTPTVLNIETSGTFDCSSALTIPALGFRKNLPASGVTPIEIPPQQPGTTIKGVCAMGMYNFALKFN
jgi:plastocyanin domain-containing protein